MAQITHLKSLEENDVTIQEKTSKPSFTDKMLEFRWVQIVPLSKLFYFDTPTKEISWILLTMPIKQMLSRLLIRLPGYEESSI